MKSSCSLLVMAGLVLGSPAAAEAQNLFAQPEILVSPAGFQFDIGEAPRIAFGPEGVFLNSWTDGGAVRVRAVSPAGLPLANALQLSSRLQNPRVAQLAALGPGRFVAVWSARLGTGLPALDSVVARLLDAAGHPLSPSLVLADDGTVMDVAADGAGGFFVAWIPVEAEEIRIGRFDAQGAPAGEEVAIGTARLQGRSIALLPGGGSVLTWFRRGFNAAPPEEIALRVLRPDGTPAGPDILLAEGAFLGFPLVSADAAGRFVAVWAGFDASAYRYQVFARRFAADGQPLGAPILVRETATGIGALPGDVAVRPDGSFLVLWGERSLVSGGPANVPFGSEPVGGNVFARAFDAGGNPLGLEFMVHDVEEGEQHEGGAAATADGWVVSWRRRLDAQSGVYARRLALGCGTTSGLCLQDRFLATVEWHAPATGARGQGTPVSRTSDTGTFWFFDPANLELVVKVLDGTGVNGYFWVFYSSLTDVEFKLTVTDRLTGLQRTYMNPAGTLASRADTEAF